MALEIQPKSQVVELFTSQGCSSCPPADKLLQKLGEEKGVLALAWHVDYWDYLGWKDVFGSPAFSNRQRQYAASLGDNRVYTPEAVINGKQGVVGSSKRDIKSLMKQDSELLVPLAVSQQGDMIDIQLNQKKAANIGLFAIWYDDAAETVIKRGENSGKTIVYSDIVRKITKLADSDNGIISARIPLKKLSGQGQNCALVIQQVDKGGNPSAILAAAVLTGL